LRTKIRAAKSLAMNLSKPLPPNGRRRQPRRAPGAALRENLRRRKAQARALSDAQEEMAPAAGRERARIGVTRLSKRPRPARGRVLLSLLESRKPRCLV
jgi:hypothetical protein